MDSLSVLHRHADVVQLLNPVVHDPYPISLPVAHGLASSMCSLQAWLQQTSNHHLISTKELAQTVLHCNLHHHIPVLAV